MFFLGLALGFVAGVLTASLFIAHRLSKPWGRGPWF